MMTDLLRGIMSYEYEKKTAIEQMQAGKKRVRGRYKSACANHPGTICYGFVFEPDPNGDEWGWIDEDHPLDDVFEHGPFSEATGYASPTRYAVLDPKSIVNDDEGENLK